MRVQHSGLRDRHGLRPTADGIVERARQVVRPIDIEQLNLHAKRAGRGQEGFAKGLSNRWPAKYGELGQAWHDLRGQLQPLLG
jgi:hypothetical protein